MYGKLEAALKDKDVVIDSLQSENIALRKQLMQLQVCCANCEAACWLETHTAAVAAPQPDPALPAAGGRSRDVPGPAPASAPEASPALQRQRQRGAEVNV